MLSLYNRSKRGRDFVPSEEGGSKVKKTKVIDNDDSVHMHIEDVATTK